MVLYGFKRFLYGFELLYIGFHRFCIAFKVFCGFLCSFVWVLVPVLIFSRRKAKVSILEKMENPKKCKTLQNGKILLESREPCTDPEKADKELRESCKPMCGPYTVLVKPM